MPLNSAQMHKTAKSDQRLRLRVGGQREDVTRGDIAGVEINEAGGDFVRHHPAGFDMRDFQRGGGEPDHRPRHAAQQLHCDKENRQQIDEPQCAERIDQRQQIKPRDFKRAEFGGDAGRLENELDGHPQQVEIEKVHDLAVEISPPVAVDDLRQEQTGDHEEVRHAERPREFDHRVHPAFAAGGGFDAERRMHHHHKDDAKALGVVDPVDPAVRLAFYGHRSWCGHDICRFHYRLRDRRNHDRFWPARNATEGLLWKYPWFWPPTINHLIADLKKRAFACALQ